MGGGAAVPRVRGGGAAVPRARGGGAAVLRARGRAAEGARAPFIATPPRDIVNVEGSDVIFGCEVSSFPMAIVEWRKEGNSIFLPADDSHMAVQARGGPQRFELTGWLQIQRVQKEDEGMYTCCAKNEFGEVSASARLQVINPDSPLASKVKPFKTGVYDITDDEEDIEYGGSGYSY
ncbi:UNVERIFIED_CONTAM: hypothetical protein FKN15_052138 [Acipenser sinensis]